MFRKILSVIPVAAPALENNVTPAADHSDQHMHILWMTTFSLWIALMMVSPVFAGEDRTVLAGTISTESQIVIEAPMDYEKISGPVDIRIRFDQKDGVKIDLDTLEFRYGLFKFDITSRIMRHVKIIKNRLFVTGAKIPPGKHKILLRVRDENGRKHERWFRLNIQRQFKTS